METKNTLTITRRTITITDPKDMPRKKKKKFKKAMMFEWNEEPIDSSWLTNK